MKEYNFEDFSKCCSEDGSKLAFPRFSVAFLQTFCIHDALQFMVPYDAILNRSDYDSEMKKIRLKARMHAESVKNSETAESGWMFQALAEHLDKPIVYMYQDIEKQIFITSHDDFYERKSLWSPLFSNVTKKTLAPLCGKAEDNVYVFGNSSVYRFSLRGFDFSMPISSEKNKAGEYKIKPVLLKGHVNVELSLFYGNTVSIAYKFFFDGYSASILDERGEAATVACTDHIITLLSCHLGAEYWSEKNKEEGSIELLKEFNVDSIWIDEDGNISEGESFQTPSNGDRRVFNNVMLRYKKYLYKHCTAYKEGISRKDKLDHENYRNEHPLSVSFDHHYAMVDIWGDVKHVIKGSDRDVFLDSDAFKLSEPDIVTHIREFHKPELVGLMTLYPSEWKYREAESYDHVCGKSIAIDTDDLVLAGTHVSVVVGTYDRRGEESDGNDWKAMEKVKAKYKVAWPEYLMILQFVLAKKVVVNRMKDRMMMLIDMTSRKSTDELLFRNANFSLDLTRQILQLDVVKYAKFASHRVMYDRIMDRLDVRHDIDEIRDMSHMLNSNLQNLSNYRSMEADSGLNTILIIVSIVSLCELLFQDPQFKFFDDFFKEGGPSVASILILIICVLVLLALGTLVVNRIKKNSNKRLRK